MDVNRGQENLDKVFYRWRLSLICVAARCSDGLCPCFFAFQAKKLPRKGSALDPPGGPDPLDSHARIRSLVPALRAFFLKLISVKHGRFLLTNHSFCDNIKVNFIYFL